MSPINSPRQNPVPDKLSLPSKLQSFGKPILVASHPRSGTHLTLDTLRRQFLECSTWKYPGEPLDRLYLPIEGLTTHHQKLSLQTALKTLGRFSHKEAHPLIKTHAYPALSHLASGHGELHHWIQQNAHKLYVVRDGRAVLCSLHLFMQSFDPQVRCSFSDFLRQEVNGVSRVKAWTNHVQTWISQPNVHVLKFEQLIQKPRQTLLDLGQQFNLTLREIEPLLPRSPHTIWQGRWARLTQWQPESSAIIGYYRGQQTSKWQTIFTPSDHTFFQQEAGGLLTHLGYDTTPF